MIAAPQFLSPDDYLDLEAQSDIRHEYWDGQAYAMAGGTDAHNTIAGNLFAELRSHLRGTGCRVFMSDMKVRINQGTKFFYPDLMVTCDSGDRNQKLYKSAPCLIVEVLSDSTEAFDRGRKFAAYRQLDRLQEYVLISAHQPQVDLFRRSETGQWVLQSDEGIDAALVLETVGYRIGFDRLYEDVVFDELPTESGVEQGV
ncbi:MAG: Uma2 family endonuclease [Oscillatoriales cyanobacterium]|nr:MAG: Uma2 family endonuclease [Oscillatoriales cyanobacterium]